jgi:hypothetical protein
MLGRLAYLWNLVWKDVPIFGRGIFVLSTAAGVAAAYMMVHFGYGPSVAMFSVLVSALAVAILIAFRAVQDGYEKRKLVEGGLPDARLSLEWRNGILVMRVFNNGADAEFDAKIDLSRTLVGAEARRLYAGVWADDPAGTTKKIFERGHEFLALYDILKSGPILTPTFFCKFGNPYKNSISAVHSYCPTSDPPVEPETHVLRVSISSTPRMVGGTKHADIQLRGGEIEILLGDVKPIQQGPEFAPPEEMKSGFIPLRNAAESAYKRLQNSDLVRDLNVYFKTPTSMMREMMRQIVVRGLTQGERWLDNSWVKIDGEDRLNYHVLNDAGDVAFGNTDEAIFRNAAITPENLERFIALFGPV